MTFERVALLSVEGVRHAALVRIERVNWKTMHRRLTKPLPTVQLFNDAHVHGFELVELLADALNSIEPSTHWSTWQITSVRSLRGSGGHAIARC